MDNTEKLANEIAQKLMYLENGLMGSKGMGYWQSVSSKELLIPTLRNLKQMWAMPRMRATIIQLAVSEHQNYQDLVPEMARTDGEASLMAMSNISIRNRPEIINPYLDALAKQSPETLHMALGKLLFKGIYDYQRNGRSAALEAVARFDLNRTWDSFEQIANTVGPVDMYILAIHEEVPIQIAHLQYTLDLILKKGANIEGVQGHGNKNPLELACQFNDELRPGNNYEKAIGLLLERGANWKHISQENYPKSWQDIQAHYVVKSWNNREALTHLADSIRGQIPGTTKNKNPKI